MIAIIVGLFIGFVMCIPIGPLNVLVVNSRLKNNASKALSIAFGGSVMDCVYFYVILSGLSFINFSDTFIKYFKLAGIILILLLGLKELFSENNLIINVKDKESSKNLFASFLLGVVIYTSNPTLIITMTALGAFIKSLEIFDFSQFNIVFVSLGLAVGSFLWFVFLVKVVEKYEQIIRDKYINIFTKVSGALMISLSLFMVFQLNL